MRCFCAKKAFPTCKSCKSCSCSVNTFYNDYKEVLNPTYKMDHSFPLKGLLDAGASSELLKLCHHPELSEWVEDQKVSGQMTIDGRAFDFAVWAKIEQVLYYLAFIHTMGS